MFSAARCRSCSRLVANQLRVGDEGAMEMRRARRRKIDWDTCPHQAIIEADRIGPGYDLAPVYGSPHLG